MPHNLYNTMIELLIDGVPTVVILGLTFRTGIKI